MPILLVDIKPLTAVVNAAIAAVELTVDLSRTATAVTVTITRTDPGGQQTIVRGADRAALSGGEFFVVDSEAPLGVEVTYVAVGYSVGGAVVVVSPTVAVTIPVERAQVWLKDPGSPSLAVSPLIVTMPAVTREVRRGIYHVAGAEMPVIRSDVRQSETGTMVLHTQTLPEAAALDYLFASGSVLLFQADPDLGIEQFYFSAGTVDQSRLDPRNGFDPRRDFEIDYIKTSPPVGGTGTAVTWQDAITAYLTWQDAIDGHTDWLSVVSGGY